MSVEEVILSCLFELMLFNEDATDTKELSMVLSEDATDTKELSMVLSDEATETNETSMVLNEDSTDTKEASMVLNEDATDTKELSIVFNEDATDTKEESIVVNNEATLRLSTLSVPFISTFLYMVIFPTELINKASPSEPALNKATLFESPEPAWVTFKAGPVP